MERGIKQSGLYVAIFIAVLLFIYISSYVGLRVSSNLEVIEIEEEPFPGEKPTVYTDIVWINRQGEENKTVSDFYLPLSWFEATVVMRQEYGGP